MATCMAGRLIFSRMSLVDGKLDAIVVERVAACVSRVHASHSHWQFAGVEGVHYLQSAEFDLIPHENRRVPVQLMGIRWGIARKNHRSPALRIVLPKGIGQNKRKRGLIFCGLGKFRPFCGLCRKRPPEWIFVMAVKLRLNESAPATRRRIALWRPMDVIGVMAVPRKSWAPTSVSKRSELLD